MKWFLLLKCLLVSISILAQDSFSKADARQLVDTFFEGFHEGDTAKMKSVIIKNLPTQTVFMTKKGENKIVEGSIEEFLTAIADRPENSKMERAAF